MSTAIKQYYTIIKQQQIKSKHGGKITELTLVGIKDRCLYRTYIDPYNRNYSFWSSIIHNPLHGYLLSGLKIKSQTRALIDADSPVEVVYECRDPEEIYNELLEVWQKQDSTSQFGNLFA